MCNFIVLFILGVILCERVNAQNVQLTKCGRVKKDYWQNGESITQLDEFPWLARIHYKNTETSDITANRCLAVLISDRYLLTLAHLNNNIHAATSVILGDWKIDNSIKEADCSDDNNCAPIPREYEIEQIVIHPNFTVGIQNCPRNDIALLRLQKSVEFTNYIQPLCLPSIDTTASKYIGQNLTYVGWQRQFKNVGPFYEAYKFKSLANVISWSDCTRHLGTERVAIITNPDSHICGYCTDTSNFIGSSVIIGTAMSESEPQHYFLIGLVSQRLGHSCTMKNPDLFVRVDYFSEWIKYNMY